MPVRALTFADLEFDHRWTLCRYAGGPPVKRWMPFGMPRLRPNFEHCAFFLFRQNPKTGKREGPLGTGFYVCRSWRSNRALKHIYAVTNWHVAVSAGASIIRVNTEDGGEPIWIDRAPDEWKFIPGSDDVAVIDVTEDLQEGGRQAILAIHENTFVIPEFVNQVQLGHGEDVVMVGMFSGDPPTTQNHPVTRFGNIARLATDKVLIKQDNGARRACHLIDMRSRAGHSGSPVFVYRTPNGDLSELVGTAGSYMQDPINNLFMNLLGVHIGQYPELVRVEVAEQAGDLIREGDSLKIPSGITTVAPAYAITEILETQHFKELRMEREKKNAEVARQIPVAEVVSPKIRDDTNSRHKEDFTALLGAAAKTKKQGD